MTYSIKLVLPFYFEATKKNDNDGFPMTFPFSLKYHTNLGIFHQKNTLALKKILNAAYLKGSMLSGGMNDLVVGEARVDEAFNFIKENSNLKKAENVLEIGCGEGQVLKKLAKLNLKCVGLEPGPQVLQIEGKNLSIIKDFFPSKKIKGRYDLILHFGVLEHIANPLKFMQQQHKFLSPNGSIFLAVPNCENDLKAGDISVFLHEHYNYFTRYGLQKLAKQAGLFLEKVIIGKDGAFLYAKLASKPSRNKAKLLAEPFSAIKFKKQMQKFNNKVTNYFKNVKQSEIAIYCPLRSMNLLSISGLTACRLVDDNVNLQNKYLPTFKNKIESFTELKNNPPKKILIYSRTFAEVIKNKCLKAEELKNTKIQAVDELI